MDFAENARKNFTKHGMCRTRFYGIWTNIQSRCNNPKYRYFSDYGGRGIKNEWKSFEEFRDSMYDSYKKHFKKHGNRDTFIERIDNNGNYSSENCRWATRKEQARNTRTTVWITHEGETKSLAEWAEIHGIRREDLRNRLVRDKKPFHIAISYR